MKTQTYPNSSGIFFSVCAGVCLSVCFVSARVFIALKVHLF